MKYLKDHKHFKKNCICSSTYPLWTENKKLKTVDFKKLHRDIAKACEEGLSDAFMIYPKYIKKVKHAKKK